MLPVLPERGRFDFGSLKGEFETLGRLNAVAWDGGAEPSPLVIQAISRHLGLEPFKRDCQFFVSYRRSRAGSLMGTLCFAHPCGGLADAQPGRSAAKSSSPAPKPESTDRT